MLQMFSKSFKVSVITFCKYELRFHKTGHVSIILSYSCIGIILISVGIILGTVSFKQVYSCHISRY